MGAKTTKHKCELLNTNFEWKRKLPPNASKWRKLKRWLDSYKLINQNHPECRAYFRTKSAIIEEKKRHCNGPYSYMIHPLSTLNVIKNILFFIVWLLIALTCPYSMAFEPLEYNWLDIVSTLLYVIYMIATCFTGYCKESTKEVILNQKQCLVHYIKTYFIFDFLYTITGLLWLFYLFLDPDYELTLLLYSSMFDYALYGRILYQKKVYFYITNDLLKINESVCYILAYVFIFLCLLNLFTGLIYLIPLLIYFNTGTLNPDSWLFHSNLTDSNISAGVKYMECFYMTLVHFFGAGNGKYEIKNVPYEQIMFCFIMFCGKIYTLYASASILLILGMLDKSQIKYAVMKTDLSIYMANVGLPHNTRKRIWSYYEYKYQRSFVNEKMFFATLSEPLQLELIKYNCRLLVKKSLIFKSVPRGAVAEMLLTLKQNIYLPGDYIFQIGEKVENIYLVSFGTVAIYDHEGYELLHLNDGEELGIVAVAQNFQTYAFSAVAIDPTEVWIMSKEDLLAYMNKYPLIGTQLEKKSEKRLMMLMKEQMYMQNRAGPSVLTLKDSREFLNVLRAGKVLEPPRKRIMIHNIAD